MNLPAAALALGVFLAQPPSSGPTAQGLHHWRAGPVPRDAALLGIGPGHILIVTEDHAVARHHENQLAVLQALKQRGLRVSVGLEFLAYPDQPWVDRYGCAWDDRIGLAGGPGPRGPPGAGTRLVISQVDARRLDEDGLQAPLAPDPRYGPRADFI